jgi:hypothetical protein
LDEVVKNKGKYHGIGSPKPPIYDMQNQTTKTVNFQLDGDSASGSEKQHENFLKKQGAAMEAKQTVGAQDFVDTPTPGTPIQQGEIVASNEGPVEGQKQENGHASLPIRSKPT